MRERKPISDFYRLREQPYPYPRDLEARVEEREARGECWWVLRVTGITLEDPLWLLVDPETWGATLYEEGEVLDGRWDPELEIFVPEDGPLPSGHALGLEEEEDEEEEAETQDGPWSMGRL